MKKISLLLVLVCFSLLYQLANATISCLNSNSETTSQRSFRISKPINEAASLQLYNLMASDIRFRTDKGLPTGFNRKMRQYLTAQADPNLGYEQTDLLNYMIDAVRRGANRQLLDILVNRRPYTEHRALQMTPFLRAVGAGDLALIRSLAAIGANIHATVAGLGGAIEIATDGRYRPNNYNQVVEVLNQLGVQYLDLKKQDKVRTAVKKILGGDIGYYRKLVALVKKGANPNEIFIGEDGVPWDLLSVLVEKDAPIAIFRNAVTMPYVFRNNRMGPKLQSAFQRLVEKYMEQVELVIDPKDFRLVVKVDDEVPQNLRKLHYLVKKGIDPWLRSFGGANAWDTMIHGWPKDLSIDPVNPQILIYDFLTEQALNPKHFNDYKFRIPNLPGIRPE